MNRGRESESATAMIPRAAFSALLLALGLVGCSTRPAETNGPVAASSTGPVDPGSAPAGFRSLWVDSEPAGGIVVLDGVPQGRTPLQIQVPVTAQGFFRAETSIRVRFIAADAQQPSATREEIFGPTDRLPSRLTYTPEAVRRIR